MRNFNKILWVLMLSVAVFTSCTKTDDPQPLGKYSQGVIVVNEGNFTDGNGSLSFWVPDSTKIYNNIFQAENAKVVGGIIQQAYKNEDKLVIVTNRSDQVIVANADDLKEEAIITDASLVSPFNATIANNKVYVTVFGSGDNFPNYPDACVKVIDLNNNTIIKTISLGKRAMGLVTYQNKVYVANEQNNTIEVINTSTDAIESTISLSDGTTSATAPSRLLVQGNTLWALCSNNDFSGNGFIVKINLNDNSVERIISNVPVSGYNEKATIYQNTLYFTPQNDEVYSLDLSNNTATPSLYLTAPFSVYGLGANPANGDLYVSESAFVNNSNIKVYNQSKAEVASFTASLGTNGFVF